MNIRRGLVRLLAVIWSIGGIWGLLFVTFAVFSDAAAKSVLLLIGGCVSLGSYNFWRISIWVVDGFFDGRDIEKSG